MIFFRVIVYVRIAHHTPFYTYVLVYSFMAIRKFVLFGVVCLVYLMAYVLTNRHHPHAFYLISYHTFTEPLLDLTCLQVSCQLMGKSAEEIRVILNIPRLTPEEEAKARQDHRWKVRVSIVL